MFHLFQFYFQDMVIEGYYWRWLRTYVDILVQRSVFKIVVTFSWRTSTSDLAIVSYFQKLILEMKSVYLYHVRVSFLRRTYSCLLVTSFLRTKLSIYTRFLLM